jgi:GGDEF domain-containing protein
MKKTFIRLYTIAISLIFIFAIAVFGFNIYKLQKNGHINAEKRLENIALKIKMIPPSCEFNTIEFNDRIQAALDNKSDFAYLQIKINNQTFYTYPSGIKPQNVNPKLIYSDTKSFTLNENNISIHADIFVLQPKLLSKYIKFSFLIILFATLLTVILILIEGHTQDEKDKVAARKEELEKEIDEILPGTHAVEDEPAAEENTDAAEAEVTEDDDDFDSTDFELPDHIIPEEPQDDNIFAAPAPEEHKAFVNEILGKPQVEESKQIADKETNEYKAQLNSNNTLTLPSEELKPMKLDNEPEGLFSPDTGFGWESYLLTRLDNELNRATASEIDLGLFIVKIAGVSRKDEITKKICDVISSHFQFKDLIFEYKNDSYVGLKIGSNSEQAFNFAQKLYVDLANVLNGRAKIYIGVSTKTIRIISGERLLKEADEALIHAQEDEDSPVVAFRANADKYRAFVENN